MTDNNDEHQVKSYKNLIVCEQAHFTKSGKTGTAIICYHK